MVQSNFLKEFISYLEAGGVTYGREDAFKLLPEQLISGRILIGIDTSSLPARESLALAARLGMPAATLAPLLTHCAQANAVFVGIEEHQGGALLKVYLEFWDAVRATVRDTGSRAPQLRHLGVKWDSAQPERHGLARYECHPLLGVRDILRRIGACYADPASALCALAQATVRQAAHRRPQASMLYLEVSEEGNPRNSFDINLYKAGMRVADVRAALTAAAGVLRIPEAALDDQ